MSNPVCTRPGHADSHVVLAGSYGKREGQKRQRWKCTPRDGSKPHRFSETLPRIVIQSQATHRCTECATDLEAWEGQPAPRLYGFTARHVAAALVRVANGQSYRATASYIRTAADRELDTEVRIVGKAKLPAKNSHAQLVSDWVEVFAPVIWDAYAPKAWPDKLLVDEDEYRYRTEDGGPRGVRAFSLLAAMGYDARGRTYVAAIEAVPAHNVAVWVDFLRTLEGQPSIVVGDGGVSNKAAAKVWRQDTDVRRCEWHLARNLSNALPADVRADSEDTLPKMVPAAVASMEGWRAFVSEVEDRNETHLGYAGLLAMIGRMEPVIAANVRTRPPAGPHSTGPLEQFFRAAAGQIGDRTARLTNKARADALFKLLAANRNGWVDELRWAELIRDHLSRHAGLAPQQRQHTDAKAAPSLRPA